MILSAVAKTNLDAAGEIELARRRDAGDVKAVGLLVEHNMRLAFSVSLRIKIDMDPDDKAQYAILGLWKAAEKFDPSRGFRFSTYAQWWIRQAVHRGAENEGTTIRLPSYASQIKRMIPFCRRELVRMGIAGTYENMAAWFNDRWEAQTVTPKLLRRVDEISATPVSLDAPVRASNDGGGQPVTLSDIVAAPSTEEEDERRDLIERMAAVMEMISPLDRLILTRRYVNEMTLTEVGLSLGITRERVRQLEVRALHIAKAAQARNEVDGGSYDFPLSGDPQWLRWSEVIDGIIAEHKGSVRLDVLKKITTKLWNRQYAGREELRRMRRGNSPAEAAHDYPSGALLQQVLCFMQLAGRLHFDCESKVRGGKLDGGSRFIVHVKMGLDPRVPVEAARVVEDRRSTPTLASLPPIPMRPTRILPRHTLRTEEKQMSEREDDYEFDRKIWMPRSEAMALLDVSTSVLSNQTTANRWRKQKLGRITVLNREDVTSFARTRGSAVKVTDRPKKVTPVVEEAPEPLDELAEAPSEATAAGSPSTALAILEAAGAVELMRSPDRLPRQVRALIECNDSGVMLAVEVVERLRALVLTGQ